MSDSTPHELHEHWIATGEHPDLVPTGGTTLQRMADSHADARYVYSHEDSGATAPTSEGGRGPIHSHPNADLTHSHPHTEPHSHYIDVVFDGPPGAVCGRFVETEDETGASINAGEWIDRGDGSWALRIPR